MNFILEYSKSFGNEITTSYEFYKTKRSAISAANKAKKLNAYNISIKNNKTNITIYL